MADEAVVPQQDATEQQSQVSAEQVVSAEKTGEPTDPANPNPNPESDPEHKKRLGGWQRAKLRAERERDAANAERDYWRTVALGSQRSTAEPPKTPEVKAKPQPKDFDLGDGTYDVAAYTDALTDWKSEQTLAKLSQQTAEREQAKSRQTETQTKQQKFEQKIAEYAGSHPGFEDAIRDPDLPISQALLEEAFELDNPAEVMEHLANNPEEAAWISRLDQRGIARQLARIEARLGNESGKAAAEQPGKTEPPQPTTQAPPPPNPVRKPATSSVAFDVNNEKTDIQTWMKERWKQKQGRI